ncbi:uncharacterized protein LOC128386480 [Panonychus citri]|uniref:uncharacterized protein LOC128386480 n=1 Tax=Panonychus citri TaxID=50023 RepID=UPI0023073A9E|nr:uncharacterized protein LOC128386480 [Panonychus citri]
MFSKKNYVYLKDKRFPRLIVVKTKQFNKSTRLTTETWPMRNNYHSDNLLYVKIMLMLFGLNMFPVSGCWRLLNYLLVFSSIVSQLYQFFWSIVLFAYSDDPINSVLWTFQAIYAFAIRFILIHRAKRIHSALVIMTNMVPFGENKFRLWSIICLLLTLSTMLFDFLRLVIWFIWGPNEELIDLYTSILTDFDVNLPLPVAAFTDFWTYCYATIGCLIVSKSFYLFTFHLASECYQSLYSFCQETASDPKRIRYISLMYHKVYNLKDELNEALSSLPFFWYSQIFFETTSQIVRNTKDIPSLDWSKVFFRWGSYLNLLIITIYITYQVDRFTIKEMSLVGKMIQLLTDTRPVNEFKSRTYAVDKSILVNQLIQTPTIIPSAWSSFNIDRTLIVSFFGAVVPFSVMCLEFQQIINR